MARGSGNVNGIDDMLVMVLPVELTPQRDGHLVFMGHDLSVSIGATLYDNSDFEYLVRTLLRREAHGWVVGQQHHHAGIVWVSQKWLITRDPFEAAAWPLPHECETCRDGQRQAVAAIHAGSCVALGALRYNEVPT